MYVINRNLLSTNQLIGGGKFRARMSRGFFAFVLALLCAIPTMAQQNDGGISYAAEEAKLNELAGVDVSSSNLSKLTTEAETYSTDDASKAFLLYNVATGQFASCGGYWGTHVSRHEYGLLFWLRSTTAVSDLYTDTNHTTKANITAFRLATPYDKTEGENMEYFDGSTGNNNGVYLDRATTHGNGWVFEPTGDELNTFKMYTYKTTTVSSWLQSYNCISKKYYLCATDDPNRLCGGLTTDNALYNEDNAKWRLLSLADYYDFLSKQVDNVKDPLDLTFMLKDPGFSRGSTDLNQWTAWSYETNAEDPTGQYLKFRFGLEDYYTTYTNGTKDAQYWTGSSDNDYQLNNGKYYCAAIKGSRGTLYQKVDIHHAGWYIIECKGYSNCKQARLFAKLEGGSASDHATAPEQMTYMTQADKEKFAVDSMLSAGKEFYDNKRYLTSVIMKVPETWNGKAVGDDNPVTIRFGISVGDTGDNKTAESDDEWTVFDEFRLLYATGSTDADLILDETKTDMEYITEVQENYQYRILHLMRNFTLGSWNTFFLPVNLNKIIYHQQFGANARLAKLHSIEGTTLRFELVDLDKAADSDNVVEQYVPYLIWPTKDHGENPSYTANLTKRDGSNTKTTATIAENHYDMYPVSVDVDEATAGSTQRDKNIIKGSESGWLYTYTNDEATAYSDLEAFGLLCQNYDADKKVILDGRNDLANCYVMKSNTLYLVPQGKQYGSKGLRCVFHWKDAAQAAPMNISIDGIDDGVTAIELLANDECFTPVSRYADGIYTIDGRKVANGTSLDGLPHGLYIVGGKKTAW